MDFNNIAIKLFFLWIVFVFATDSHAQKRVALIIGNSDYQVQSLKNPVNDATDISLVLRNLGFEVELILNVNQEDMEEAIQGFGNKIHGNTVGLFYFSGHGVQYEASNYLIPIGAMESISAPDHLKYNTLNVGYVLGVMKQASNALNIVILDACRNNPFKSLFRSAEKGLTRQSGVEGTIIAYSTSPGNVAIDGIGRNSPYAKQLIELMKSPNVPIELMLKEVRKSVKFETGGMQSPWYEASIDGDFYFLKNKKITETENEVAAINHEIGNGYTLLLSEDFSNNNFGWPNKPRKDRKIKVRKGTYYFEHKRDKRSWVVYKKIKGFNKDVDFKISLGTKHVSGIIDDGFGIAWGRSIGNLYFFQISADGYFRYSKSVNKEFFNSSGWRKDKNINRLSKINNLTVERKGNTVLFFINDVQVYVSEFEPFDGSNIGMRIDKNQAVEFDNLSVSISKRN